MPNFQSLFEEAFLNNNLGFFPCPVKTLVVCEGFLEDFGEDNVHSTENISFLI